MRASLRRSLSAVAVTVLSAACATAPLPGLPMVEEPPARPGRGARRSLSLGVTFGPTTPRAIAQATEGHGAWVASERFGAVWLPAQPQGFIPYVTDGRWLVTDAGWYWQSTLPWGDLAFHYGRWIPWGSRWGWVPGTQFAPAWVDWRAGNGWVAWAPQSPLGASSGASFVYCPAGAALDPQVSRVVVRGAAASSIYPRTQPIAPVVGYLSAQYAFGPPDGVAPVGRVAPLTSVVSADAPLSVARPDAPDTDGETLVDPPAEVAEVPAVQGSERDPGALASRDDRRAPVRIRAEDLSRASSARVSVVNMPYGARAELFQRPPRVAASPPPPVAVEPPPAELAPLPPPADAPLAWWPMTARGRAVRRAAGWLPGAAPAQAQPYGPPTSPLIGMSAPPPPSFGVPINTAGGLGRGVAVVPATPTPTVVNTPRMIAAPAVNAPPVGLSVAR